jgi:hypothetical protein
MEGFKKLYGRLRQKLPKEKGEVKGKRLSEEQVIEVVALLRKVGCLFEVAVIDMGLHTEEQLLLHKVLQEKAITAHLTSDHHPKLAEQVRELRRQLETMPLQLYVQSVAMGAVVYNTLNHADLYYAFHKAPELGEYHWTIDAKERSKVTRWEEWWQNVILPMLESHSFREPFIQAEGADYRWHERFKTEPSDYKMQFVNDPKKSEFSDLRLVMTEDFRFSSDPEFGLEAVDVLTNAVRRSMSGNFSRRGWVALPQLMVHRNEHYIKMISLSSEIQVSSKAPYMKVLNCFRSGGRSIFPKSY